MNLQTAINQRKHIMKQYVVLHSHSSLGNDP